MKQLAEKKRNQNIGEYIIYMYQMEDLIRSYQFNMEEIRQYVISHYPISAEEKEEISDWFLSLSDQMKQEGITETGHLSSTQKEVDRLAKIHWDLLKTDKEYFQIYNNAKPHVMEAILSAEGKDLGHEIQVCLNGVYGLLLCRLTGKKISPEQEQSAEAFGDVLSYLNLVYMDKKGKLS
ncbi:DUF4924 family protein [Echinicola jeungdonensis]|uniref:DUF4924 family protein n=1 Tax=Echinicola jeungdonensis TaxID=709343 RepID=A0ABV5J7V8_9BACT|nr:DUF4924 family protein [Echinicola jeungdonensis]MDN3670022.1 DUF4924 family protein [Echinicola jeungdonensis]